MTDQADPDLLYGSKAIARFLGLTHTQVQYRYKQGDMPIRRMGKMLVASRKKLEEFLRDD